MRKDSRRISTTEIKRAVLKPSIIGIGSQELHVQPLWSNDCPEYHKIKIKNNFYCSTRRSSVSIPSATSSCNLKVAFGVLGNQMCGKGTAQWNPDLSNQSVVRTPLRKMTRRTRTLDVHSLSKSSYEGLHPLPEKPEDQSPVPQLQPQTCVPVYSPDDESAQFSFSTSSSPPTRRFSISSSSETGDNITTGRSSAFSLGNDDEFDRKASMQVHKMFDEIDSCLFEKQDHESIDECNDWSNSFPYMRLLGTQIHSNEETGTQFIQTTPNKVTRVEVVDQINILEDVEAYSLDHSTDVISVVGQRLEALTAPSFSSDSSANHSPRFSHLEEEIFANDGDIEEFIAFDNCESNGNHLSRVSRSNPKRKHGPLPPVTPLLFIQESIISECFDQIWIEIIGILKNLLTLYVQARKRKEIERFNANFDLQMDRFLESAFELPVSRDHSSGYLHPSRLRMEVGSGILTAPSDANRLKELITIRSVPLQHRAPSVIQTHHVEDYKDSSQSRPASSSVGVYRQFPKTGTFRAAEQNFYDRMLSAKNAKRATRLQPLQTPKTAGQMDLNNVGEIRGTKLQTPGDQGHTNRMVTLNQQMWGARNGMLPPIDRLGTADTQISHHRKSPKRGSRASSAVSNNSKVINRDRILTLPDSRPNTMLSYLSDQPLTFNKSKSVHSYITKHANTQHNDHFYNHLSKPVNEDNEINDLTLWGHGPPLISQHEQRKGKSFHGPSR